MFCPTNSAFISCAEINLESNKLLPNNKGYGLKFQINIPVLMMATIDKFKSCKQIKQDESIPIAFSPTFKIIFLDGNFIIQTWSTLQKCFSK